MSYTSKLSSLKKFSLITTASGTTIAIACFSCATLFPAAASIAAEKLPSVELHLDAIDGIEGKSKISAQGDKQDPFAPEKPRNVEHKNVESPVTTPDMPLTGKMPFSTTPSEPLKANELPKKKHKKPAKKPKAATEVTHDTKKEPLEEKTETLKEKPVEHKTETPVKHEVTTKTDTGAVKPPAAKEPEFFIPPTKNELPPKAEPLAVPASPVDNIKAEPAIIPATPKEPEALKSPEVKQEPLLPVLPPATTPTPAQKIEQEQPIIPTPTTKETELPKLPQAEPLVKESVATPPPPPPAPKPEKEAPVTAAKPSEKTPSVAITPMPPAPTPNEEFIKALTTSPEAKDKGKEAEKPAATATEKDTKPQKPEAPAEINKNLLTSIKFLSTEATLPISAEEELKKIAKSIKSNNERITLFSYASESADQATTARRVSMARALAVRAFLIEQGIDSLNINVRAEGSKNIGGEPDRVDIVLLTDENAK